MASMTPVRTGLIGLGTYGGETLLPALKSTPGISVEAVCGSRLERTRGIADRHGVKHALDDFRALIAMDEIELVCVATPPILHAEMTSEVLAASRHAFSTKPLATTYEDALQLAVEANRKGVVHAMDLDYRYRPVWRYFRELVSNGYLGELRLVVATILVGTALDPRSNVHYWRWLADASQGGGILRSSFMNHYLDLIAYTFGPFSEVDGIATTLITEKPVLDDRYFGRHEIPESAETVGTRPVDSEDTVVLHGRFDNGAPLSVTGTWSVHHGSGPTIQAYGSEGTLILQPNGHLLGAPGGSGDPEELAMPERFAIPRIGSPSVSRSALLVGEIADTIRGVCEEPLFATFDDALRLSRISFTILDSKG